MTTYAAVVRFRDSNWGRVKDFSEGPDGLGVIKFSSGFAGGVYNVEITGAMPIIGDYYDFDSNTFTDISPGLEDPRRNTTAKDFWLNHFTALERAKVWAVCAGRSDVPKWDNSGAISISITNLYRLMSFRDLTLTGSFYLEMPELCTVVEALETIGLLAPGRANEILERP